MKNSIKRVTALLFGACLGSLVSIVHADWYDCAKAARQQTFNQDDFVCCQGKLDSTDSSSLQLTGSGGNGSQVVCMANNVAGVWANVGYRQKCYSLSPPNGGSSYTAYRCGK